MSYSSSLPAGSAVVFGGGVDRVEGESECIDTGDRVDGVHQLDICRQVLQ